MSNPIKVPLKKFVNDVISGFIEINEQTSELVIKPGELYQIDNNQKKILGRSNRFIKPGESIFSEMVVQKLSYSYSGIFSI